MDKEIKFYHDKYLHKLRESDKMDIRYLFIKKGQEVYL